MLGPSIEEIAYILGEREQQQGPMINAMRQLRDTYNGDLIIPLPEIDRKEKPAIANLITQGLDQSAMRIASTMPNVYYPALKEGDRASEKRAAIRKRATLGWWEANKMPLKMRRRARWLIGYASSPVILRPDTKWGAARWDIRDPLNTFPAMSADPDNITPSDVIFKYTRSRAWLASNYPEAHAKLQLKSQNPKPSDVISIVEWNDGEATVLMASAQQKLSQWEQPTRGVPHVELERIPNRTGMCLAVVPGRITLDRPMGQFDSLVGMYNLQAKLMALEVIAVERGIFPDTYLVSRPGETARFVAGPYDGRSGQVNVVSGGDIKEMAANPGFATNGMIDRIERAQRIQSGIPAEFGGESTSNVRTGKRGDAILSAVVDFPIQEAQEILAASMQEENIRAVAIAKTYFGNERKSFYVSGRGSKGHVDYIPNRDFETDNNIVSYSHSGADANALVVGLGQRIGIGIMSKTTAQEIDPFISDPELEKDRVVAEGLEQALLQSVQAQAQQGVIPPADIARIVELVSTDTANLAEAVQKVHEEAQKRQATQAPQGAPETMPGLGAPGMGAEQPAQEQAPQDLRGFLASLGGGQTA